MFIQKKGILTVYFDPFYFKIKMYFQFLEDSCGYGQTIWYKIIEMHKIKRICFNLMTLKTITESDRMRQIL